MKNSIFRKQRPNLEGFVFGITLNVNWKLKSPIKSNVWSWWSTLFSMPVNVWQNMLHNCDKLNVENWSRKLAYNKSRTLRSKNYQSHYSDLET